MTNSSESTIINLCIQKGYKIEIFEEPAVPGCLRVKISDQENNHLNYTMDRSEIEQSNTFGLWLCDILMYLSDKMDEYKMRPSGDQNGK